MIILINPLIDFIKKAHYKMIFKKVTFSNSIPFIVLKERIRLKMMNYGNGETF